MPGTFAGGAGADAATALALLPGGGVVAAGNTASADFPATAGAPAGSQDVWVSRFDARFRSRAWTVRFGGAGFDEAAAVAVDPSGDVYLAGTTTSADLPAAGGYDPSPNGGRDVFLVKLDGDTGALLFATYLGGSLDDEARDLGVDAAGRAFLVGSTRSADFPQEAPIAARGLGRDAFFAQFSADGGSLLFSSYFGSGYFGGVFDEEARALALDAFGNPHIALFAADPDGTGLDFNRVIKLSGASRASFYDFPYGPQPPEAADGLIRIDDLAVDELGRATFAGTTLAAASLPLVSPWQSFSRGGADFFLARLGEDGATLEFSSYLGGEGDETDPVLALGGEPSIAIAGSSNSSDYPLRRPLDAFLGGRDGVYSRFSGDAAELLQSTYFGGAGDDAIAALAIGADEVAVAAGITSSPDLAIAGLLPGGAAPDGFAARLAPTGIARHLPRRTAAIGEPAQVPEPYATIDLDGDGVAEEIALAPALPLLASSAARRGADGRDLLSVTIGSLGGIRIGGVVDADLDGEQELVVDDPSRPRGFFEGWLLDNGDLDVDLVVRGVGGEPGLLAADLDGDGEDELVAGDRLSPDSAFEPLDNADAPPDGDADVIFVGGLPRAALDLDGDGEPEIVAEMYAGTNGAIEIRDGIGGADGDADVIFVAGSYQLAADLDADGRPEAIFSHAGTAPGTVQRSGSILFVGGTARAAGDLDGDGDLELVAESADLPAGFSSLSAEGVVFIGGSFLGLADLDGDGEEELLATSSGQPAGSYSLGIGLESPADLDPDIVFLPPGTLGVADLDGDGELEIAGRHPGLAAGATLRLGGLEAVPDGDADVVFVGGEPQLFADLDGDSESELIVRDPAAAAGSAFSGGSAESVADGDGDVLVLGGTARLVADLDGDGESEVAADAAIAAVAVYRAFDAPGDLDPDLVMVPGRAAAALDLDGDGELELVAADPALPAGGSAATFDLETAADGDPDVVRVGGEPRLAGDLDGDGENELAVEAAGLAAGEVATADLGEPGGGDADLVFVRGGAARFVDLDGDGDAELLADDAAAAGAGGALVYPLDGRPAVVFLGGALRTVADLDGDGELEAVAEAALAAGAATTLAVGGSGADLVLTGGRARAVFDLDGDGEQEVALEASGILQGTALVRSDLEGTDDGDGDLIFTGGRIQGLGDLDGDGESELLSTDARIAAGSSFYRRDLDAPGDSDADLAFVGIGVVPGVRDPNGGEIWFIGSTHAIRWDLACPGNVRVQLSRDGGATFTNLIGSTPNDGEQLWDVRGTPTDQALARVQCRDNPAVTDQSDAPFIIPPASLELTHPDAGETFAVGQVIDISWNSENLAGGIEVALSRDGGASWEIIDPTTPNDGSKSWRVTGPATSQAVFRVRSAVEPSVADLGSGPNSISGASLAVTSPNGGETLLPGSTAEITWSSSGLAGALHVDLSRDGGATWQRIITNTANDGVQAWLVTGPATSQALVRLTSVSSAGIADQSDAPFTIAAASVTVIAPNGGETVWLGSQLNLQWSSANLGGNVRIDLSRDGGATWETLFATTPNDGNQPWRVAGAPTSQALIRVASRTEASVADTSDASFTIPPASLTLTSPNGGESWTLGSSRTITWTSSNLGGTVDLELSRDGGATWTTLFANTANDGNQAWTVTGPPTAQARIRVRSIHVPVADASDASFAIP